MQSRHAPGGGFIMDRLARSVLSRIAPLLWLASVALVALRAAADDIRDVIPPGTVSLLTAMAVTGTLCGLVADRRGGAAELLLKALLATPPAPEQQPRLRAVGGSPSATGSPTPSDAG